MKKAVLTVATLCCCLFGFSQKTTKIDSYIFPRESGKEKMLLLEMPYGKADILHITGDSINIREAGDIFVDVICTDYPSGKSLQSLNQKRVKAFLKRFPFLQLNRLSQVHFYRQTDGAEKEKAVDMFHGMLVRYRPRQSVETMKDDIVFLDDLITTIEIIGDTVRKDNRPKENRDSILYLLKLKRGMLPDDGPAKYETRPWDMSATGYDKTRRSPRDSSLVISPKMALRKGLISKAAYKAYNWTPWVTLYFRRIGDTMKPIEKSIPREELTIRDTLSIRSITPIPDSTLIKIFSRTSWKNYTIVADVTVSMYPYSAQLLLWIKLHELDDVTHHFVFFNDGDDLPDDEKKIGSTGGIYLQECESFDEVKKLIREAMEKGSGGDRPENDIEALLSAEKHFPASDFQVLIADNRAPVKDKSLWSKLTKPVRIILCGADAYNINADYLNLARQTKGSLHLLEEDLYDLAALHEGENLKIGKKNYKLKNGLLMETDTTDP